MSLTTNDKFHSNFRVINGKIKR